MNWKNWSSLWVALLFCLAVLAILPICAEATSTQPATEPEPQPAEPDPSALGLVLILGTVLLVITWAMVIWLFRRFT